jgi:hypothetical protein
MGSGEESRICARMMAGSEPWITLKRGYEESLTVVEDPSRECTWLSKRAASAAS